MARVQIGRMFDKYGPSVYRRALVLLGNPHDAEEATQEVFLRACKHLDSFEKRSSVHTWLIRITTNHCLNLLRDRRRRGELWEQHMKPAPGHLPAMPDPENLLLMRRLLAAANESEARAAVYVFIEGMSHAEAADCLGVSRRTVGNLIERFRHWAAGRLEPG